VKTLLIAALVVLVVPTASALIDDGEDSLGIYFDAEGDVTCFDPTPGEPFTVYFILVHPQEHCIGGFEFSWRFEPPLDPAPAIYDLVLPPNSLNIGDEQNIIVGVGGAWVVPEPAVVLASCTVMTYAEVPEGQGIAVGPPTPASIQGHALYHSCYATGDLYEFNYSTVPENHPVGWWTVASLDCDFDVVATRSATWSAVKALYE
jgi:hypothetical protein